MTTTMQDDLKKEADFFSVAAQRTTFPWLFLCSHLTIWGPPRSWLDFSSPYPSPCFGLSSPFPTSRSTSSSFMLRPDWGLTASRVACVDGRSQKEGPRPANPVLASLARLPQPSFQTQNSSPAPPLAPSGGWLEMPKPWKARAEHSPDPPKSGRVSRRSKVGSPCFRTRGQCREAGAPDVLLCSAWPVVTLPHTLPPDPQGGPSSCSKASQASGSLGPDAGHWWGSWVFLNHSQRRVGATIREQ